MKANAQKIADGVYWIGVLDWEMHTLYLEKMKWLLSITLILEKQKK